LHARTSSTNQCAQLLTPGVLSAAVSLRVQLHRAWFWAASKMEHMEQTQQCLTDGPSAEQRSCLGGIVDGLHRVLHRELHVKDSSTVPGMRQLAWLSVKLALLVEALHDTCPGIQLCISSSHEPFNAERHEDPIMLWQGQGMEPSSRYSGTQSLKYQMCVKMTFAQVKRRQ